MYLRITPDKGLPADQAKVRAIIDMPAPKDPAEVQRLLRIICTSASFYNSCKIHGHLGLPVRKILQRIAKSR